MAGLTATFIKIKKNSTSLISIAGRTTAHGTKDPFGNRLYRVRIRSSSISPLLAAPATTQSIEFMTASKRFVVISFFVLCSKDLNLDQGYPVEFGRPQAKYAEMHERRFKYLDFHGNGKYRLVSTKSVEGEAGVLTIWIICCDFSKGRQHDFTFPLCSIRVIGCHQTVIGCRSTKH